MDFDTILWGVDLGGTKIEVAALRAGDTLDIIHRERLGTEAEHGYEHILERIALLIDRAAAAVGRRPANIGLGHPGSIEPSSQTLKNSNTLSLNGRSLIGDLTARLQIPIHCQNDANCFALAEARYGAAVGAGTVFGIIMGTGVGGGIVVHGQALVGRQGLAGEWGHNVLEPDGAPCYCGKRGCVECVLCGPALEEYFFKKSGCRRSLEEVAAIAEAGGRGQPTEQASGMSHAAQQTLERLYSGFGRAIAVVVNILDPDIIVLGGGVSNVPRLEQEVALRAKPFVFNPTFTTPIVKNQLGDSAGVIGAALLSAPDRLREDRGSRPRS